MLPKPEATVSMCPVCGELGRVYAYGEQVVTTGPNGVGWVLGQGVCQGCLRVVVQAAREGSLPASEEGA
jgi:hypothetical protein